MDSFAQPTPNYHLSASTGLSTSGSSVTTWDSQQGSYSATQSNNSRRPVLEADGINGQPALAFDGSNDYLLLPDQNGFNTGGPFAAKTIAMVFETGSDITSRQMIYEQGGSTRGLNMSIHNGNLYLNGWNVNEDNWGPVDIHTPVATNTTYVAVLVFDASTIFGYVNGNLIGSAAVTGPLYNHGDDGALGGTVGSTKYYDNTNSRTYFQGKIAEWYSYNIALGDSDRSALEQTLSSRYQSLRLSIPMDLEGVNITSSQVDLSWTDTSDNETGFILERSTTSGSGFVVIDTANADENSYTDTGLASGTNYYYRAKTLYDGYNSDYTSELMITTHSRGPIAKSWDFDVSSEGWVGTGVLLNPTGTGVLNFSYNGYGSPRIQSPSNPGVNL
ncbi:MAG: LamG-like jellyroll fold domain-containing protein, partial [Bacteroidota bacterium]